MTGSLEQLFSFIMSFIIIAYGLGIFHFQEALTVDLSIQLNTLAH